MSPRMGSSLLDPFNVVERVEGAVAGQVGRQAANAGAQFGAAVKHQVEGILVKTAIGVVVLGAVGVGIYLAVRR